MPDFLVAIVLGIVEGVTEFIPVSSTGHLVLATTLLGLDPARWAAFNVIIQLGAILAIVVLYWRTFWDVLVGLVARRAESCRPSARNAVAASLRAMTAAASSAETVSTYDDRRRKRPADASAPWPATRAAP